GESDGDVPLDGDAPLDGGVTLATSGLCSGGWCWQNPLPQGHDFSDVWVTDDGEVWALGLRENIVHFDGARWFYGDRTGLEAHRYDFNAVIGTSRSDFWGATQRGLVHWDGSSWTEIAEVAQGITWSVAATSPTNVWSTSFASVYQFDGATWTQHTGLGAQYVRAVWTGGPSDTWIVNDDGTVAHYDGMSWQTYTVGGGSVPMAGIHKSDSGEVRSVSRNGDLYRLVDGAFISEPGPTPALTMKMFGIGDHIWLVGGTSLRHYDGVAWSEERILGNMTGIYGRSARDLWVVGQTGLLAHFDGATWTRVDSGAGIIFEDVWGTSEDDLWAGAQGSLHHYDGSAWTFEPTYPSSVYGLWGTSRSDVWAVGAGGSISRFDGATWSAADVSALSSDTLHAVWGTSSSDVWAVGASGTIAHFDGSAWTPSSGTLTDFYVDLIDVWGSGSDHVLAVGREGTVLEWNGASWAMLDLGVDVSTNDLLAVWGTAADNIWIVGGGNAVLHFDGMTWTKTGGTGSLLFAYTDVYGSAANDVWISGTQGQVQHFDGMTWTATGPRTYRDLAAIFTTAPGVVWTVGVAAIFHTPEP
ncbi:MAG: hypothetical protein KC766_00515, partial [Myxococcales bacterium]|nr:hypothetical protein [Myxococcales bacterium]